MATCRTSPDVKRTATASPISPGPFTSLRHDTARGEQPGLRSGARIAAISAPVLSVIRMDFLRLTLLLLPGLALAQAPVRSDQAAPAAPAQTGAPQQVSATSGKDGARAPAASEAGAPTTRAAVDGDPASLTALFHRRDEAAAVAALEAALEEGLKARPDDFELLWRKAQLRWNQADRVKGKERERLGKEVWQLGERAAKLKPSRVEGHYWAAVGVGAYSQGVGLLAALTQGLEGRFNGFLDKAIQLDPNYLGAAPLTAKGRAHFELPWPKRNLDASAELLRQATAKDPGNLRAWLYLAETELERGRPQEADAALARALQGSVAYDPPEARHVKGLARQLAPKVKAKLGQ